MNHADVLMTAQDELGRVMRRIARRQLSHEQRGYIDSWALWLRINRGLQPTTAANYVEAVAEFAEWTNERGAGAWPQPVTPDVVNDWQQHQALALRLTPEARHVKLVALRQVYRWGAAMKGWSDPTAGIAGPKRRERVPRKFSRNQLQRLFATCDRGTIKGRRDYAVLLFFLATGARRSEVAGLTLQQLELRSKVGAVRFVGKGSKERMVAFEGEAVDALRAWLADLDGIDRPDPAAVFVALGGGHRGRRLGTGGLHDILQRAAKKAAMTLGEGQALHRLRATFATALYDQTRDIERVRIAMGHDDINTTREYLAISDTQMQTRLSGDFLAGVTGASRPLPLWLQHQQRARGNDDC